METSIPGRNRTSSEEGMLREQKEKEERIIQEGLPGGGDEKTLNENIPGGGQSMDEVLDRFERERYGDDSQ